MRLFALLRAVAALLFAAFAIAALVGLYIALDSAGAPYGA